ncbi:MAG: cytochrome c3 family protein [Polaromonas sp.]
MNIQKIGFSMGLMLVGMGLVQAQTGSTAGTKFTNQGSIANTRHNLTQRPPAGGINGSIMDGFRSNYGEVCVYCHTPHGADTNTTVPLWNRTTLATTYKTYNELKTSSLTQTVSQPGANSLSCLSCHDGQTAMDSVINMPGSDRYKFSPANVTKTQLEFLDTWPGSQPGGHQGLNSTGCLVCHGPAPLPGVVPDFRVAVIGTDLTNDHPVGITFPTTNGANTEFKTPTGTKGNATFFDVNGNGNMDKGDVRLYDAKVECASCHDPHGVPSGGPGTTFNLTFMRLANTNSAVCLTCHAK